MYALYLDGVRYPVAPKSVKIKIRNQNETVTLINEGEINLLKTPGLSDISFTLLLPHLAEYPFAVYPDGFQPASYYLEQLERLKTGKEPFQFILARAWSRTALYDTSLTVSLESYTVTEDKGEGADVTVEIELKQYREGGTKTLSLKTAEDGTRTATVTETRSTAGKEKESSYTTKNGDTLAYIARKYLQDSAKQAELYRLNRDAIEEAARANGRADSAGGTILYPGTVLRLE